MCKNTNMQSIEVERRHTSLHRAVLAKDPDLHMIKRLLEKTDIDVDRQNSFGHTALIIACHYCPKLSPDRRCHSVLELVSTLFEHGCNVHLRDNKDYTALSYAIIFWSGNTSVIDLLISYGADINNYVGRSPFENAIARNDEEEILMLLCCGADPRPFFSQPVADQYIVAARELMYPFVSLCDIEVLRHTDLDMLYDMWPFQDMELFARWCLEQDPVQLMRAIFSTRHKVCLGIEVFSRLLHTFFNERLLDETMYYPATNETILDLLPQFGGFHLDDSDMADVLRILLSNINCMHRSVVEYLQKAFRNPAGIAKVLEDFNMRVVDDCKSHHQITKIPLLWRMYASNTFKVQDLGKYEVVDELLVLSRYHRFNLHMGSSVDGSFFFPNCDCTLVELCRNRIRQLCQMRNVDDERPFAYAKRIKALAVPERLKDVLLLRRPLYPQTSMYKNCSLNYSSRW